HEKQPIGRKEYCSGIGVEQALGFLAVERSGVHATAFRIANRKIEKMLSVRQKPRETMTDLAGWLDFCDRGPPPATSRDLLDRPCTGQCKQNHALRIPAATRRSWSIGECP